MVTCNERCNELDSGSQSKLAATAAQPEILISDAISPRFSACDNSTRDGIITTPGRRGRADKRTGEAGRTTVVPKIKTNHGRLQSR